MPSQTQSPSEDVSTHYRELIELTVQVSLACVTSGLRYWQRTTELFGNFALTLSGNLSDVSAGSVSREEAWESLREHLRAHVRAMGELAGQESRLLQVELEAIERKIWPATEAEHASPPWRRRARAKL